MNQFCLLWYSAYHLGHRIVSDASPLIALAKLDRLDLLLGIFSEVHIPKAVYLETTCDRYRFDSRLIYDYVKQHVLVHNDCNDENYRIFNAILDEGESQALALAIKLGCGVLIDDRLGRHVAKQYTISSVGIRGILLRAKSKGTVQTVRPLIEQLLRSDYRLSNRVIDLVLRKAGEL